MTPDHSALVLSRPPAEAAPGLPAEPEPCVFCAADELCCEVHGHG